MRLGTLALTFALALGLAGLVSAEESGNWFTRLFQRSAEKAPAPKNGVPTLTPVLPKDPTIQAQADLQRRRDVCQKLMELAVERGDDDLYRKAEQLDLRAWDAYIAVTGRARLSTQPIGEVSMRELRDAEKKSKGGR
jgi:hypothetical protein